MNANRDSFVIDADGISSMSSSATAKLSFLLVDADLDDDSSCDSFFSATEFSFWVSLFEPPLLKSGKYEESSDRM